MSVTLTPEQVEALAIMKAREDAERQRLVQIGEYVLYRQEQERQSRETSDA